MADASVPQSSGVRLFPPGVYLAGLVAGYAVEWFWPVPIGPGGLGTAVRVVGVVLIVAGFVTAASGVASFRRAGTNPNPTQPSTALVVTGPYRFTRNPMYLGLAILHAGLAAVGNALWPLIALVPVVWIIRTQVIDREEAYLDKRFGEAYRAYKARVRRWL
jgi:protein-S-isoprenylcysteine O-methyltransferase Ste14